MIYEIPLDSNYAVFEQTCSLDGRQFVLRFNWNERAERWFLSIADADGNDLAGGIGLCAHYPLLLGLRSPDLPAGEFVVVDSSSEPRDPQRDDLGTRAKLLYLDASEGAR